MNKDKVLFVLDAILADRYETTIEEAYKNTREEIKQLIEVLK